MSGTLVFSPLPRRKSPLSGAFFTPADLSQVALIRAVEGIAGDLVSAYADPASISPVFQLRNTRSLVRKVKIILSLLASLGDGESPSRLPLSATTCLKELYILINRARVLLDFCAQASRFWLLIHNSQISGHFHDLNVEIATLLDVFPLREIDIAADLMQQVDLLHRQCQRSKLFVDPRDESLRLTIFSFIEEFDKGRIPDPAQLRTAFVHRLGIRNPQTCCSEIEYLEEQIYSQYEESDPSLLGDVVAIVRYGRFRLFGILECCKETKKTSSFKWIGELAVTIPKDFCCPISLDLMRDPVITSSGQTYDRASITQWMDEGHCTCPNSGQMLSHNRLMPNRALRSLISQWCLAQGIPYDPPDGYEGYAENIVVGLVASASRAAKEANRRTAEILIKKLSVGSESEKTAAAREIRLLAKTGKENRSCIAELGAIPLLESLLSLNSIAQENSVTAMLNLSIHERNKRTIMEQEGCLRSIVNVLMNGLTAEARENAAATLFSLSAVHIYKKRISDESGAVEALAGLLREGTPRGKKDAVTALFNLSTHPDCSVRMVESGAISALVEALKTEGVAEEAAGALALLVRQEAVVNVVGKDDSTVASLVGLMRRGSAKGKENAVAALHELCRRGGVVLTQKVARTPALGGLIQTILFTGTKRAKRKAASLVRLCQKCEPVEAAATTPLGSGWGLEYAVARSRSMRNTGFVAGDVSVSVSVAISVPVL